MKRRTRIISAVCAAALLGSAMTMPAAAYPMHMNGEAEVPLAQVLQMLENDKTAYVEKGYLRAERDRSMEEYLLYL